MKDQNTALKKIHSIMGKGTKKEYVELYEIINRGFKLDYLISIYNKKYQLAEDYKLNIIKRLQYFDDAEDSEMPKMIKSVRWIDVKDFFAKETIKLAKKYI